MPDSEIIPAPLGAISSKSAALMHGITFSVLRFYKHKTAKPAINKASAQSKSKLSQAWRNSLRPTFS